MSSVRTSPPGRRHSTGRAARNLISGVEDGSTSQSNVVIPAICERVSSERAHKQKMLNKDRAGLGTVECSLTRWLHDQKNTCNRRADRAELQVFCQPATTPPVIATQHDCACTRPAQPGRQILPAWAHGIDYALPSAPHVLPCGSMLVASKCVMDTRPNPTSP